MRIISDEISFDAIQRMAEERFGDMVKAVVDIKQERLAVDGELHADLEALLLENGSRQNDLWGINLYPELPVEDFVEFDAMINLRPSQGNKSRGVEDPDICARICAIVAKRIVR